jgi:hypothetical protein
VWYSEYPRLKAAFSTAVRKRLPTHFQRGIPPAIASSSSNREPITTSAIPASIGFTMCAIRAGSYWLSACTITTASAPSRMART